MKKTIVIGLFTLLTFLGVGQTSTVEAANPIEWSSNYAQLKSEDFYIRIGDSYFYGNENVEIHSNPGSSRTTLEVTWYENNVEMRLYMYFQMKSNNEWELYDLRTYNGNSQGDWIYYNPSDYLGNEISSLTGHRNYAYMRKFLPISGEDAEIYCGMCDITAFSSQELTYSTYGYAIEILNTELPNSPALISSDSSSPYGVAVALRDSNGMVVKNQSNLTYNWTAYPEGSVQLLPESLKTPSGCSDGIIAPCPDNYLRLYSLNNKDGYVKLTITENNTGNVIASTYFLFKTQPTSSSNNNSDQVVEYTNIQEPLTPETSQVITPSPTLDTEKELMKQQIKDLEATVANLEEDVKENEESISVLQKIVNSLEKIFGRFLGRN